MNRLYTILLLLLLSCQNRGGQHFPPPPPDNVRLVTVRLVDSLGTVTVAVPGRYDTSFSWINWSDCGKACAEQEYRFQSSKRRVIRESGFIFHGWPHDSVDQLTISHGSWIHFRPEPDTFNIRNVDSVNIHIAHEREKEMMEYESYRYPLIVFDTVERIYDRYFSIIVARQKDTIDKIIVQTVAKVQGFPIKVSFNLMSKREDTVAHDFIKNSLALLRYTRFSMKP